MTDTLSSSTKTPLYSLHQEKGAHLVSFGGYALPLHYPVGIVQEHHHTRTKASLFDVSHMGQIAISGKDPATALETLTVGDIHALSPGSMLYTLLTNDQGGIIDDIMILNTDQRYRVIVNAARKSIDIDHLRQTLDDYHIDNLVDQALLALQGPQAVDVLGYHLPEIVTLPFLHVQQAILNDVPMLVCRSGYTGEDGFELCVPGDAADALARLLLEDTRVELAGLGCRDTLRLEAGLCLYGHDLDTTTTPIEAALTWTIGKRRRRAGGFPGAATILDHLKHGPSRRRVGLLVDGHIPARQHTSILDDTDTQIGMVTSGSFSPTLNRPIAMGYVTTDSIKLNPRIGLQVRGRRLNGHITPLPFIPAKYFRG